MTLKRLLGLMLLVSVVITACGNAAGAPEANIEKGDSAAMENPSSDSTLEEGHPSDDAMMEEDDSAGDDMMKDEGQDDAMMEEDDSAGDDMIKDEGQNDAMMEEGDSAGDDMMKDEGQDDAMMEEGDSAGDDVMKDEAADDTMMNDEMALPGWFSAQLTDVNTGQPFSVKDYQGKVVLVETLAVWCSNCLRQQKEVQELHTLLGEREDFISIGLDIDINETAEVLGGHSTRNGFDWLYAVAPREVAREIGQLYGDQFLNPPSTPMLIIDRHGETHPLPFGIKSATDLLAALQPFLNESS